MLETINHFQIDCQGVSAGYVCCYQIMQQTAQGGFSAQNEKIGGLSG
jgi:hypothetical protein